MPYKSDAQRKFFHTDTAKKEGITGAEVKEFDQSSKGKELPEHTKKMAEGGEVKTDIHEPGIQDASVSDFLAPYLMGPVAGRMAEGVMPALAGLGESGAATLGGDAGKMLAPKMEEAAEVGAPKIEAFVKGIQKGPSGDVKIWGVKGDPTEIEKLGFGKDPGSIPEHILRQKGILPDAVKEMPKMKAPNTYSEGGFVENMKKLFGQDKSEAEQALHVDDPTPPAMPQVSTDTAKGYSKGGEVENHVTFMEDQTPEEVKKTVHMTPMAEGGAIHKAEGRDKEPTKPKDAEVSHEEKLKSIYKTLGMKKYADGGPVLPDFSQPDPNAPPSQNDPSFWDKIKLALAQSASPITGPTTALASGAASAAPAMAAAASPAISALNTTTGMSLPVPANPAPASADMSATEAPAAPIAPPPAPVAPAMTPMASPATPGSSVDQSTLDGLFKQSTAPIENGVTADDRNALASKMATQQHGVGNVIAQALAGLGDAFAAKGGRDQHSLQGIFSMQKDQRDEALANFDKARQDRLQKVDIQTKLGNNAIAKLAAQDAYGSDEHLNSMLGAPKGTAHKDLPLYLQMKTAEVAQQEKDADLYMRAHAQAASEVDAAVKNASMFNIKPSPAQLQASGAKLADQYFNKAKGNILFQPSDGQKAVWIPAKNIQKAKQMDPHGQIVP